jgi:pyruvate dehydrogenase E2 component (dihydrolipoamide acetyltransferase)
VTVPDIGGATDVDVIEVCVNVGDEVEEGDSLIVLETDKASMEVPALKSGKVISLAIKEGDSASLGTAILDLEVTGTVAAPQAAPQAPVASKPAAPAPSSHKVSEPAPQASKPAADTTGVYAGPAVRMLARELGVDVAEVKGTGPRNRITKDDLKAFVKDRLSKKSSAAPTTGSGIPAIPAVDFSQFGDITIEKLSKIARVTAANMQRNWLNVPHVTQFDDADISELEDFRASLKAEAEKRGVKITPLPFILKAVAAALKAHPKFNSSLHSDGENIVYKHYINIGMAVDTPAGLMVPVIKDVDKKSIWDLAAETVELAGKAKDRKLKPIEMQGACFTISSLGGIGGQGFTPIVNAPEVGILGISKLAVKPVWNGSEFLPRKMLPLCLSYDHRAINGGDAGRFLTYLTQVLADIRLLVL